MLCLKSRANETDRVAARWCGLMSLKSPDEATSENHMERRVIRVDCLPDQAGITAALRRAFAERPVRDFLNDDDPFAALLKQIH